MASTTKKIVITALATGGIVAGVATASAAPLRSAPPVAATSAEAEALHAQVADLTGREHALRATLQATLQARQHAVSTSVPAPDRGSRATVAVEPTTVAAPPPTTAAPASTTPPPAVTEDRPRGTVAGASTATDPESENPTTTSTPADPDTATTPTAGGATHGDGEGGAHD